MSRAARGWRGAVERGINVTLARLVRIAVVLRVSVSWQ